MTCEFGLQKFVKLSELEVVVKSVWGGNCCTSVAFLLASRHCGLGHSHIRCILANMSREIGSFGIIHLLN